METLVLILLLTQVIANAFYIARGLRIRLAWWTRREVSAMRDQHRDVIGWWLRSQPSTEGGVWCTGLCGTSIVM
jgi:hypothetical protein